MAAKAGRRRRKIEHFLRKEFKKVDNQAKRQPPEYIFSLVEKSTSNTASVNKRNKLAEMDIGTPLNPIF
ncbi:hypothetical protein P9597_30420 [Aneurinibacillus migulanus]|uniref:hypothetical protein n=1 Tax=Aneurinibacillus migulanus TaxID=47500 RepID=UPI002E1F14CC|nr:hypothetical protein [Aneurinibacillus migulanus]